MTANNESNEIHIVRVYDAPVELVWDAWVDPDQTAQWWGPRGFTLTTHSKDLRPDGIWHYTMHGPDGVDYPNKTVYHVVEEQKKLVYDHGGYDDRPPLFRVTVLFTPQGNKTCMDMRMTLPTPEEAKAMRQFIKEAGGNATWDRLAEYLQKQAAGRELFIIHRSFDASKDAVFNMWIDPAKASKWLAPAGSFREVLQSDVRPGGEVIFHTTNGSISGSSLKLAYQAIDSPCRLVYTRHACNAQGEPARDPHHPAWPETLLATVLFTDEGPGATRVTLAMEPAGDAADEEIEAFVQTRHSLTKEWTDCFDRLESLLVGELAQA